jgi:LuxR family maltose regulon positive regulatory protein
MIGSAQIQAGTLLNGRYRLDGELGHGGMGVVYRAHDALLERDVAIKVLSTTALSAENRARLLREAQAAAKLNHPNIVSIYDVDKVDGVPFIVLELVEGRSLYERRPRLLEEILSIAQRVCAALEHAHTHGIIHRDLKPENVLIAADDSVKLMDFGLAHLAGSRLTTAEAIVGTVFYLAPEQALGQEIDGRADLYALGIMLYELTTGQLPYAGDDPLTVISQHLHAPVVPPSAHNAAVSPGLDALIVRLLSKRPEDRPASATEVRRALDGLIPAAHAAPAIGPLEQKKATATAPLLQTKLYTPPVQPELVPRPRLLERLNAGANRKLTLISAPAGFGKTTLVAEWLNNLERPFTWLSLDEGDNDPVRFITYLVAALQKIDGNVGQAVQSLLGSPHFPPIDSLVTPLINDIATSLEPFALVLDDYHVIHVQLIHSAVEFLITHQPPQVHLVLVARQDPPLPLSRLRVRGQVTEIRVNDLRFTRREAAAFLNRTMDLDLSEDDIAALEARTEGWIAGLQLAALALRAPLSTQARKDVADFIQDFGGTHRYVIDYLAEEVLQQQPDEIRAFLRQTSILDRLSAPLCDIVTDRDDSATLLRQLEEANLFLIPLDGQREWYRYHHLFADFLRSELGEERQATLYLKAARWFAEHNLREEAANYALASGEMNEAARIIVLAAEDAVRSASFVTLMGWLEALPDELVRTDGELATYTGFMLCLTNRYDEASVYAKAAGQSLPPDAPLPSRGRLLSLQAHIALFTGALESAIQRSKEALDCLGDGDDFFRDLTFNVLGQSLEMEGDVTAATEVYYDAVLTGRKTGSQLGTIVTLTNLLLALNELGRRREAVTLCHQVLDESAGRQSDAILPGDGLSLAWSLLSYEANELDSARDQVLRALALCERANILDGILWGQHILARVHLACGEIDGALKAIQKARRLSASGKPQEAWFAALEADINLRRGDLAVAARWARAAELTHTDIPHHWDELPYFTYARLLLAQDRTEEAGVLLATIERSAREGKRHRKLITVYLLQALVQRALGDELQAIARVEDALRLAAPEDYYRAFLDEGQAIARLLPRVHHVSPEFVDDLIEAFRTQASRRRPISPASPVQAAERESMRAERTPSPLSTLDSEALTEPLSERELQVLRLVANGLSNREVSQALFVTVGTVKKHLNNVFGKLGVKSRTQAVARARDLSLLP